MEKIFSFFDNLLGSLGIKALAEGTHLRKTMNFLFVLVVFTFLASASVWAFDFWMNLFSGFFELIHGVISGLMPGAETSAVPPAGGVTPELPALIDGHAAPSSFMVLGHSSPGSISL